MYQCLKGYLVVLLVLCLSSCNLTTDVPQKSWVEQLQEIESEIDRLRIQKEQIIHQENERERQSLIYMRDDWSTYSHKMESIEKDHQKELEIEKKIKALKEKRTQLIDTNKNEK